MLLLKLQQLPPAFLGARKARPLVNASEKPEAWAPLRDWPGAARIGLGNETGKKRVRRGFDVGNQFFCSLETYPGETYPLSLSFFFSFLSFSRSPLAHSRTRESDRKARMQTILATRVGAPLASAKAQARSKGPSAAAPAPARIIGATAPAKKLLGACPCFFFADSVRRFGAPLASPLAPANPTQARVSFVVSGSATENALNDSKKVRRILSLF